MIRLSLVIFFLTITSVANANTDDELKAAWRDTGYGMAELMSESEFGPSECVVKEKTFAACLMALNTMVSLLEENPQDLALSEAGELELIPKSEEKVFETMDDYYDYRNQLRSQYASLYGEYDARRMESLFEEVEAYVKENAAAENLAYIAGQAYNDFLKNAFDPRARLTPASEFYPKPREYFGIGAYIATYKKDLEAETHNGLVVTPMDGSPAEKAGLVKGDRIIGINGESISEWDLQTAVSHLKGPKDTVVKVQVQKFCDQTVEEVEILRGPIVSFKNWVSESRFISLDSHISDPVERICDPEKTKPQPGQPQALYLNLSTFQEAKGQSLCNEFIGLQIKDLLNPDSVGMIFDIRGNGGGSLNAVACMLDSIVKTTGPLVGQVPVVKGKVLDPSKVQTTYEFHTRGTIPLPSENRNVTYNKKIVVLVDKGSASASEIFAGSIQDTQRGWVVGERTFGKGSVQRYFTHYVPPHLREKSDEKLFRGETTAIYTLHSGRSPQRVGIIPDFHYSSTGETIATDEEYITSAEKIFNSIVYDSIQWEQPRPEKVKSLTSCAFQENMNGELFKEKLKEDERYGFPQISDYQLALAKDILLCSPEREPYQ